MGAQCGVIFGGLETITEFVGLSFVLGAGHSPSPKIQHLLWSIHTAAEQKRRFTPLLLFTTAQTCRTDVYTTLCTLLNKGWINSKVKAAKQGLFAPSLHISDSLFFPRNFPRFQEKVHYQYLSSLKRVKWGIVTNLQIHVCFDFGGICKKIH